MMVNPLDKQGSTAEASAGIPPRAQPDTGWVRASMVALALLVTSGIGYRYLQNAYRSAGGDEVIRSGTLSQLPTVLGDWQGTDQPMEQWQVRMTATTDHLSRTYTRQGTEAVSLFVGYGPRPRDLLPHRPEVCYPVSGWAKESSRDLSLDLPNNSAVPCRLYHFRRSGLRFERVAVINWWLVGGEPFADIGDFRWQVLWKKAASPFVVQVQLARPIHADPQQADDAVRDLALEVAPAIRALIREAMTSRTRTMGTDD